MAIETVSSEAGEIVSLEEAKRHLGVWDDADDSRVDLMRKAARAYCEEWAEITLRVSASRTYSTSGWPQGGWVLRHPPVTAIDSVTYYDTNGVTQTLAGSNYRLTITQAGHGVLEYTETVSLPSLATRNDAVTVNYTVGWASADVAPADAKAAILLILRHLYGEDDSRDLAYSKSAAMSLLAGIASPTYA